MTEVAILDVGHGNCAVVHEGDACLVIDAGPNTSLLEFLIAQGISRVDEVLISHADSDHLKGLLALLDQREIVVASVRLNTDAAKHSKQWDALLRSLDDRRRAGTMRFEVQLVEGQEFQFSDCEVEVLAPSQYLAGRGPGSRDTNGRQVTTNTISAVVRVRTTSRSIVFAGDLDGVGLEHLMATQQDCSADVLVFPHHGGNTGIATATSNNLNFADKLLAAVNPALVVFSISRVRYLNPRPEIVETAVRAPGRKVMCTQMSKHCCEHVPAADEHMTEAFSDGRRSGHCCAGTIVIGESDIRPSVALHSEFVRSRVLNALCMRSNH